MADSEQTANRLVESFERAHSGGAGDARVGTSFQLPAPDQLSLETVSAPHTAFFGSACQVSAENAAGRVAAEQLTPYPPGIPVVVPGERLTQPVIDYLRSGLAAGMAIPDATDSTLQTFRVGDHSCRRNTLITVIGERLIISGF